MRLQDTSERETGGPAIRTPAEHRSSPCENALTKPGYVNHVPFAAERNHRGDLERLCVNPHLLLKFGVEYVVVADLVPLFAGVHPTSCMGELEAEELCVRGLFSEL